MTKSANFLFFFFVFKVKKPAGTTEIINTRRTFEIGLSVAQRLKKENISM